MDKIENIKRPRGRPRKTEEEKKDARRIYMQKYQKKRYYTDAEYKELKKKLGRDYYNSKK